MKAVILFLFSLSLFANEIPDALRSRLNQTTTTSQFGEISFRQPKIGNTGEPLLLLHGVYAGSTHMAWREILPKLDDLGFRVFVVDLPGTGENATPTKQVYKMELLDQFVKNFIEEVIGESTFVMTESLLGVSALKVAGQNPELFKGLILLSPTGINTLAASNEDQDKLFNRLYNSKFLGNIFYKSLFFKPVLRFFLNKTVYNDELIDDLRIQETQIAGDIENQKWISLSFVGGQIYRSFEEASANVTVPTLMIFGEEAESVGSDDSLLEKPENFIKIRPDFESVIIPKSGQSVQREKPLETATAAKDFIDSLSFL